MRKLLRKEALKDLKILTRDIFLANSILSDPNIIIDPIGTNKSEEEIKIVYEEEIKKENIREVKELAKSLSDEDRKKNRLRYLIKLLSEKNES